MAKIESVKYPSQSCNDVITSAKVGWEHRKRKIMEILTKLFSEMTSKEINQLMSKTDSLTHGFAESLNIKTPSLDITFYKTKNGTLVSRANKKEGIQILYPFSLKEIEKVRNNKIRPTLSRFEKSI